MSVLLGEAQFSTGVVLSPRGHLVMPGGIFGCHKGVKEVLTARNDTRHLILHRLAAHSKALSGTKCQYSQGWETLSYTSSPDWEVKELEACHIFTNGWGTKK